MKDRQVQLFTITKLFLALALIALAACSSSPAPHYYLLDTLPGTEMRASSASSRALEKTLDQTIGLVPFELPAYLDRPQIVVRRGVELELLEFHRWAEPLEDGFSTLLAERIAENAGTDRVLIFPWSTAQQVDLRIKGRVTRFDVDASGLATLSVLWWTQNDQGQIVLSQRHSQFTRPATPGNPASMVEALASSVDALAAKIAAELLESGP